MTRAQKATLPAMALVLAILACASEEDAGAFLTLAIDSGPASLDPRLGSDEASKRVNELIYNGLFRVDEAGLPEVDLAESYERPDPFTVIVRVRRGVRFHDGAPVTSQDVVYTYRSILEDEVPSFRKGDLTVIETIEAADERTVLFRLSRPFAPILTNLNVPILKHDIGADAARHPIGTGPFRLTAYRKDEMIDLVRFGDHFAGAASVEGIRLRIIPSETGRLLALLKGSVDMIVNDLTPDQLALVRETPGFVVESRPGRNYVYMAFNMKDPILSDVRVRTAIALALDREEIVRHLLHDLAMISTGFLPPDHWAHSAEVKRHAMDREGAKKLLDAAGQADPDGDGPAVRFKLTYKTPSGELARQIATIIQQQLAAVGIEVTIRSFEWPTFYDDLKAGRFQMVVSNWTEITDPDVLRLRFHSRFTPPHGFNRGGYENAEVDRLLEEGAAMLGNAERRRVYAKVQEILSNDLPYISLWHRHVTVARSERVQGFRLTPGGDFHPLRSVRLGSLEAEQNASSHARRRPRTFSTSWIGTAPDRITEGGSVVRSRMVEAWPPRVTPPSRIKSTDPPIACSTSAADDGAG